MEEGPKSAPHVLIFPLPAQGHVNSMLKLAELLALAGLHVTFLNTDYNHDCLVRYTNILDRFACFPGFQFKTIPDGLPPEHPRSGEIFMKVFDTLKSVTKPLFREMLFSGQFKSVTCIIADGILSFPIDVGNELGIPVIHFRTIGASCLWAYFSIPDIIEAAELPIRGNGDMDRLIRSVPGMESFLRCRDLPSFCRVSNLADPNLQLVANETRQSPRACALILNTFEGLEGPMLSHIRTQCPKIYTIGPLHALLNLKLGSKMTTLQSQSSNSLFQVDRSCMTWLDAQPLKSVIYVSFGSITIMTKDMLMEFWHGLVNSKKRFLWVIRPDLVDGEDGNNHTPAELVEGTKERGYLVSWAPQEEVLAHPAIGGFFTHSGWNSTLESIVAGVPMICWPYFADQQVNSRFVSEVWKLGMDMKDLYDRVTVEKMVNDLMVEKRSALSLELSPMATINLPTRMSLPIPESIMASDRLAASKYLSDFGFQSEVPRRKCVRKQIFAVRSMSITERGQRGRLTSPNGALGADKLNSPFELQSSDYTLGQESKIASNARRKTKIVCTIGPSTSTREMIWKLAEVGMDVARLNMSHGDHASHQKTIDLVKEYNAQFEDKVIAIMLDTKGPEVRSGDVPKPILLKEGQEFNFTIKRGVSTDDTVSVNYDDFVNDVEVGDILLVDGGMMSLAVKSKTQDLVKCVVVDGGELKSRRHLNVRGKSATLPSITEKDWEDIKFGVDNQVDFYAVSFVKDARVVHELKDYLKSCSADIHVIVKIESADSIPNLHSIISASDGAMVARGDLGAELPIEDVPLLQEDIIRRCHSMEKPVIVATNMLESMINHPTPTRAEVSDIAIAVREGADAIMLSGETAHGKYPLKAVKVMHTVALRTESSLPISSTSPNQLSTYKSHMGEMFAFHATTMANTLNTTIIVFTRTGSMAILLSHYQPSSTIFAFTNEERIKQRLVLYRGVMPIYMQFSDDAEETFSRALRLLLDKGQLKEGEHVTLVQSGAQPIWRVESTHHIQIRKVQG